jgi:outer membrane protein assembly factor BamB
MARRTEYASFLGPPRRRNRDFAGLENRVALRVFVLPALVVGFVAISVWWFALRDDNSAVGGVLTLEDATIPTVLLPSGAAADDAGLLLSGVSLDCEEELTNWTSFQGSITHQGCIQAPTISNPTIEWRIFTGIAGWLNSPLIVGDRVFVASAGRAQGTEDARDGVYAYNLYTGRQEWFFGATLDMNGLGYGNGILVATGDEGRVWGIDATDGSLIWVETLGVATFGYPLVLEEDNLVVVGDADGVVTAYNLRNGGLLWQRQVEGPIRGGAVSDGEMIVIAGENRDVLAVDKNGTELWRVEVKERDTEGALARIWAAPTIVRDLVVITMLREDTFVEPAITALRTSDGSQVWQATDAAGIKNDWGSIRSSVAVVGDLLVYGEPYSDRWCAGHRDRRDGMGRQDGGLLLPTLAIAGSGVGTGDHRPPRRGHVCRGHRDPDAGLEHLPRQRRGHLPRRLRHRRVLRVGTANRILGPGLAGGCRQRVHRGRHPRGIPRGDQRSLLGLGPEQKPRRLEARIASPGDVSAGEHRGHCGEQRVPHAGHPGHGHLGVGDTEHPSVGQGAHQRRARAPRRRLAEDRHVRQRRHR